MGRQGLTGKTAGREAFQGRAGKAGAHTTLRQEVGRGELGSRAAEQQLIVASICAP